MMRPLSRSFCTACHIACVALLLLGAWQAYHWQRTANVGAKALALQQKAAIAAQKLSLWLLQAEGQGSVYLRGQAQNPEAARAQNPEGAQKTPPAQGQTVDIPPQLWFTAAKGTVGLRGIHMLQGQPYLLRATGMDNGTSPLTALPLHALPMPPHAVALLVGQSGQDFYTDDKAPAMVKEALKMFLHDGQPAVTQRHDTLVAVAPLYLQADHVQAAGAVALYAPLSANPMAPPYDSVPGGTWLALGVVLLGLGLLVRSKRRPAPPQGAQQPTSTQPQGPSFHEMQRLYEEEKARRRQLSAQLIHMLEKVRQSIAHELHDHMGQRMTTLLLHMDMAASQGQDTQQHLAKAAEELRHIHADMRGLAHGLRPPLLDTLGLEAALRGLCDAAQSPALEVHFFSKDVPPLDSQRALMLYRVAQEALGNAVKHAKASSLHMSLVLQGDHVLLSVEDNGRGFVPTDNVDCPNASTETKGLGLALMRERMHALHGTLSVESAEGRGVVIMARIPV